MRLLPEQNKKLKKYITESLPTLQEKYKWHLKNIPYNYKNVFLIIYIPSTILNLLHFKSHYN